MFEFSEKFILAIIEGIYNGGLTEYDLPEPLYRAIANTLKKGLYKGFEADLSTVSEDNMKLLTELRENVYMFSAAKTYQQVRDMIDHMTSEDGVVRPFNEFKELASDVFETYNVTWLRTEYDTAIGQAQSALKWSDIESQKEVLPILKYSTVGDENTCEICGPLDGMTAPVEDPIWDVVGPINHFHCRCLLEQLEEGDTTTGKDKIVSGVEDKMDDIFKFNPGKEGIVFSPEHPYFTVPKKDLAFAKDNFGLSIPEED